MVIYRRGRGFALRTTREQIQQVVKAGLEPGTAGLRVRLADHSAVDCKTVRFFSQNRFSVAKREVRLPHTSDFSRALEYAKIGTVLQSNSATLPLIVKTLKRGTIRRFSTYLSEILLC